MVDCNRKIKNVGEEVEDAGSHRHHSHVDLQPLALVAFAIRQKSSCWPPKPYPRSLNLCDIPQCRQTINVSLLISLMELSFYSLKL